MNNEVKMLDDIFKFLQRTPISGDESEKMTQAKQYIISKIQAAQVPPRPNMAPLAPEGDTGD
jgi:hypothetical protein